MKTKSALLFLLPTILFFHSVILFAQDKTTPLKMGGGGCSPYMATESGSNRDTIYIAQGGAIRLGGCVSNSCNISNPIWLKDTLKVEESAGYSSCTFLDVNTEGKYTCKFSFDGYFYSHSMTVLFKATGVEDHSDKTNSFTIFPNPVANVVNVHLQENTDPSTTIEIIDVLGKTIYTSNVDKIPSVENTLQLNVSEFKSGIYFVCLKSDEGVVERRKIMLQH
jgi:hypothetical protein